MRKLRDFVTKMFHGRHGLDSLGKMLFGLSFVFYIMGMIFQKEGFVTLGACVLFFELYRWLSRQHWDREEENRKYLCYVRLWKLKNENRKHSKIYMCTRCGKYIRVPKGKGKIQVTCTACGDKTIRRT